MFHSWLRATTAIYLAPADGGTGGGGTGDGGGTGGGGGGGEGFAASLPEDLRDFASSKGYADPAAVVRNAMELEGLIGHKRIAVPQNDDAAAWSDVFKALGRPDKPDYAELKDFKAPEGLPWDGGLQTKMVEAMHGAGLNGRQVRAVMDAYADASKNGFEAQIAELNRQTDEADAALKADWGDKYDAKIRQATAAARDIFGDDFDAVSGLALEGGRGVFTDPRMVKALVAVHEKLGLEDELPGSGAGAAGPSTDLAAYREQVNRDPEHAYWHRNHPEHKAARERMSRLYAAAVPGSTEAA